MNTRLSALMDDELEVHELDQALHGASRDARLRGSWQEFHLIGDALRGESHLDFDISAKVMAALDAEPTVLAPPRRTDTEAVSPFWALAASAAGVAVVAWVGLGDIVGSRLDSGAWNQAAAVARVVPVEAQRTPQAPIAESSARLREYLVAHQTHASTPVVSSGTHYVRTVAPGRERP